MSGNQYPNQGQPQQGDKQQRPGQPGQPGQQNERDREGGKQMEDK